MLTAVLVVTTLPSTVPVSLELVEQICYTVGRTASEMNEVSGLSRGAALNHVDRALRSWR